MGKLYQRWMLKLSELGSATERQLQMELSLETLSEVDAESFCTAERQLQLELSLEMGRM